MKTFLEFVITNDKTAGTGGLPAYKAAADKWLAKQASSGFYAGDFKSAVSDGGGKRLERLGLSQLLARDRLGEDHYPGLAAGKTIADLSADWQKEMKNEAQVNGYTVN